MQDTKKTGKKQAHWIDSPKRLYTLKEAAMYMGRPVWGMRELIWNGKISYIQDGRKYYVDVQDMDRYIDQQKTRSY